MPLKTLPPNALDAAHRVNDAAVLRARAFTNARRNDQKVLREQVRARHAENPHNAIANTLLAWLDTADTAPAFGAQGVLYRHSDGQWYAVNFNETAAAVAALFEGMPRCNDRSDCIRIAELLIAAASRRVPRSAA